MECQKWYAEKRRGKRSAREKVAVSCQESPPDKVTFEQRSEGGKESASYIWESCSRQEPSACKFSEAGTCQVCLRSSRWLWLKENESGKDGQRWGLKGAKSCWNFQVVIRILAFISSDLGPVDLSIGTVIWWEVYICFLAHSPLKPLESWVIRVFLFANEMPCGGEGG